MTKAVLVAGALFLCACARNKAPERRYTIHGEIISLEPEGKIAKIKHQAIEGWMGAMTMEFPVRNGKEYKDLKAGDCITATVFVQDLNFAIEDIHHDQCAK